jgi:hypothetical protein
VKAKLLTCLLVMVLAERPAVAAQLKSPKPIKVSVKVEAQGAQSLWSQEGTDLPASELASLRALIDKEIRDLGKFQLVPSDEKEAYLALVVSAEKLDVGRRHFIVLSSVLEIATTAQTDLFVTHDVIVESTVEDAAHAVVGQLVSEVAKAQLTAALDAFK